MRYNLLILAAAAFASAQTSEIGLGQPCAVGGTPCALGAGCYAVNSMAQTVCGNFQASCTSNEQCAFNTCEGGLCSGFRGTSSAAASSTSATITSTPAQGAQPAPSSTVVAPAGSLPLGAPCNPYVKPSQCANDAQCWASNEMIMARCGNFNAACTADSQCDKTSCNHGLCNGFLASSSAGNGTTAATPAASVGPIANGTVIASMNPTATTTGTAEFTGAASAEHAAGGILAMVFGAIALAL